MNYSASMDKGVSVDKNNKFGIGVMAALLGLMFFIYYFASAYQKEDERIVQEQLEAIEEKRLTEAYYTYTSKDFQSGTPLEGFKKFLSNWPILSVPHTVHFKQSSSPGKVQTTIKTDQDQLNLLFLLKKLDGEWKIQKIEVVNEDSKNQDAPDFDETIFLTPVKGHIEALKSHDLNKAYQNYTAAVFKEATPIKEFSEFIKDFSVFFENSKVDYKKLTFNNNIGTYEVLMTDKNGTVYDLKYELIAENGAWKILQIQIAEAAQER